jgi:hypothetical protein
MSPRTCSVVTITIALLCAACSTPSGKAPAPAKTERDRQIDALGSVADAYRDPNEARNEKLAGWSDYQAARDAVSAGRTADAVTSLKRARDADPECAEYWYNLGAAQANLAIETVNDDESAAVAQFRNSVDSKRRARELMDQGKWRFYDAGEQAQVRSDCDAALRDADAVLADEASLIAALKMYASR